MTGPLTPVPDEPSGRSRLVALALNVLLGFTGAHRFYAGKSGTGVLMLLTIGGCGLWWMYDLVLILGGEFRDADGRRIVRWSTEPDALELPAGRHYEQVLDELDQVRAELAELHERVDFTERLLARGQDPGARDAGGT